MKVKVDQLESLWPTYRGHILLRAARESKGRISNANIAIIAGHIALSLEVHRLNTTKKESQEHRYGEDVGPIGTAAPSSPTTPRLPSFITCLRLTVLLDAVPHSAPKPNIHQMTKFLTRILEPSEMFEFDQDATDVTVKGQLGEDVPELLVVENKEKVISSSFLRLNGIGVSTAQPVGGLAYACIEADGLLRLWKWEAEGLGWHWVYLNRFNLCACREDPQGSRVLAAAVCSEPETTRREGSSRHRIVWEQEDRGEGAGLGLALTSAGPHPPRSVWSRRITFDVDSSSGDDTSLGIDRSDVAGGNDGVQFVGPSDRLEISIGFSVRLLPTGCDKLLCSRHGAWLICGERLNFNHFETGRISESGLTCPPFEGKDVEVVVNAPGGGDGSEAAFTYPERDLDGDPSSDEDEDDGSEQGEDAKSEPYAWRQDIKGSLAPEPLFAVHEGTGDIMMYDPSASVIRVVGLPVSGGGGLTLNVQCSLESRPPAPPRTFAVRLNQAILVGGGVCSVYDLCSGRTLGETYIPWCRSCSIRRRKQSSHNFTKSPCTCGRWQRQAGEAESSRRGWMEHHPVLWVSETRGHFVGLLSATQVLRIRLPGPETCAEAMLAPVRSGVPESASRILEYVREYQRLVDGGKRCSPPLLLEVLRCLLSRHANGENRRSSEGVAGLMDVLSHAFPEEMRGSSPNSTSSCSRSSLPPWLLLAMLPAAQQTVGRGHREQGFAANQVPIAYAEREDPSTVAAESQLRNALEDCVAASLHSLDRVRDLLRDPAGSARPMSRGGIVADDGGADELNGVTAGVDPATVLFEDTLRSWMACRGEGMWGERNDERGSLSASVSGRTDSTSRSSIAVPNTPDLIEDPVPIIHDGLALAFQCEVAGETEAHDVSFLRLLLEGSRSIDCPSTSTGRIGGTTDEFVREVTSEGSSAASTFLCLHLVGQDASMLFEVACRALFRLRSKQLPRFVERLARFRMYVDEIKHAEGVARGRATAGEGASSLSGAVTSSEPPECAESELSTDEVIAAATGQSTARRDEITATTCGRRESLGSIDELGDGSSSHPGESPGQLKGPCTRDRSSSIESTRTLESGDKVTIRGSGQKSSDTPHSRERSADSVKSASTLAESTDVNARDAPTAAPAMTPHGNKVSTARSYFSRALACLPPAAEDGGDGTQRRARLELLMGARMFTEACRLLCSRAWEGAIHTDNDGSGSGKSWKYDRGAVAAWTAAMRLLDELKRAAEGERGVSPSRGPTASSATSVAAAAASGGRSSPFPPVDAAGCGGAALQYRLAFEDVLAQTIIADEPDRMKMVMMHRPAELAPVAVVRLVRRAVASMQGRDDSGGPVRNDTSPRASHGVNGLPGSRGRPLSPSTRTLKRCLLLLVESSKR